MNQYLLGDFFSSSRDAYCYLAYDDIYEIQNLLYEARWIGPPVSVFGTITPENIKKLMTRKLSIAGQFILKDPDFKIPDEPGTIIIDEGLYKVVLRRVYQPDGCEIEGAIVFIADSVEVWEKGILLGKRYYGEYEEGDNGLDIYQSNESHST